MLTHKDRTVTDCLSVLDLIRPLKLRHIGFKDVGVDKKTLATLAERIRGSGATAYMEVVSTSPADALNSARVAVELGIDRLLGGTDVMRVREILGDCKIGYYPFCGFPTGHPTRLDGSPDQIEAHCRRFIEQGCAGTDLLAYRATAADPLELVRAARRGLGSHHLIVAGSVTTGAQIAALHEAGADAFTIGSAVFDRYYAKDQESTLSQLAAIQADCAAIAAEAGPA
ncbi:MAG TPA: hypothetical protein VJ790_19620 [Dongiaceae bacterium]|nr:hypothetical protein [Dongiaceae bacterium]